MEESGAKVAVGRTTTIADGGYPGTGLVIPHRRPRGGELTEWQAERGRECRSSASQGHRDKTREYVS
jgi:hypothetical protein